MVIEDTSNSPEIDHELGENPYQEFKRYNEITNDRVIQELSSRDEQSQVTNTQDFSSSSKFNKMNISERDNYPYHMKNQNVCDTTNIV